MGLTAVFSYNDYRKENCHDDSIYHYRGFTPGAWILPSYFAFQNAENTAHHVSTPKNKKGDEKKMNLTCIIFGFAFIVSGILFFLGKLHSRITAWKTMTESEKMKIPIVKLCRNIGTMIFLCGVIFLVSGLNLYFKEHLFIWFMIGWLLISGIDVFLIEKQYN